MWSYEKMLLKPQDFATVYGNTMGFTEATTGKLLTQFAVYTMGFTQATMGKLFMATWWAFLKPQ